MRILITGGAGYVGSHLCALLRGEAIEHVIFDDLSTGHAEQVARSRLIEGDIRDETQLLAAFAEFKPDMVINLAAMATLGACQEQPEECWRINVAGTRNVLDAMRAHKVRHIVHASSCAVYAPLHAPDVLSERLSPLMPASTYGKSKLEGERLLDSYHKEHGIVPLMFRIFNIAGAHPHFDIGEHHEPETHLVPLAIEAALGRRAGLSIFGEDYPTPDGTAVRDYIHVLDVARAFLHAAHYLASGGAKQAVNLGSGIPTSVRQLLASVGEAVGKPVPSSIKGRREGDTAYLVADSNQLRTGLGFELEYSELKTIVTTALRWHRRM